MKIDKVSVRVGELRSTGYPTFSNRRVEVELTACLEPGETASAVKDRLLSHARKAVAFKLGDIKTEDEMDVPF